MFLEIIPGNNLAKMFSVSLLKFLFQKLEGDSVFCCWAGSLATQNVFFSFFCYNLHKNFLKALVYIVVCSAGTCKGVQMQRTNSSRCHRAYGSTKMARVKESHGRDNMDVTCEIHRMEMEAYNAVLRAFIAQSSVLSWVCFKLFWLAFSQYF